MLQMNQLAARTLSAAEGFVYPDIGPARPAIEASLPRRAQSNQREQRIALHVGTTSPGALSARPSDLSNKRRLAQHRTGKSPGPESKNPTIYAPACFAARSPMTGSLNCSLL